MKILHPNIFFNVFGITFFGLMMVLLINGIIAVNATIIDRAADSLKTYVKANNGNLPEDQNELYDLPNGEIFRKLNVQLAFDPQNVFVKDRKVFDKTTSKQVFIIQGPFKIGLKKTYEFATFELYQEITKGQSRLPKTNSN